MFLQLTVICFKILNFSVGLFIGMLFNVKEIFRILKKIKQ